MKDTDYLSLSARVRVLEGRLLDRERQERMLEARTDDEAVKVFTECGYPEPAAFTVPALDAVLAQARRDLFAELLKEAPEKALVEVFQIKYDIHNAKALVKAEAMGVKADRLLMAGGRFEPQALDADFHGGKLDEYPPLFREAVRRAAAVLSETGDPQRVDQILDRAGYAEMEQAAKRSGSPFLAGYVRLSVDAANLRTWVRCRRMGLDGETTRESLLDGGNVPPQAMLGAKEGELPKLFAGPLERAAQEGMALAEPGAGRLTGFERMCDNALVGYLSQARRVPFGEQPVVGYLCAREAEAAAARTILAGRMAGLSPEAIRERLRDCYV